MLETFQQAVDKINRVQNILEKFQHVMDKIKRVQKMLGKFKHAMDKLNRVHKMLGQVSAGSGHNKQSPGGARQAKAGYRESRVGPEPHPGFPRQVGPRHNQPTIPQWQWNRIYLGDPFRPRNIVYW